jgi:hypothetical protein
MKTWKKRLGEGPEVDVVLRIRIEHNGEVI